MSLWDRITGEFIDIVEWTDDSRDTMVYRFERRGNEIKYGAKLTVREGQVAVFVNEGTVADVFMPGMYTLETQNIPILSTLQGWKYGFESPFKAEIYFVSTRQFTSLKWGTKNPVILRDREFGAIRARAFGTYSIRVNEPATFLREVVGTDGHFTSDEISDQLRDLIVTRFSEVVSSSGVPILDMATQLTQFGEFVTQRIKPAFAAYGLDLTLMLVENISLPPEVEEALDKRTSMGIIGDMNRYMQYQTAEAMEAAANNPGGAAGGGMSMGMGMVFAQNMAATQQAANQQPTPSAPAAGPAGPPPGPPPLPGTVEYYLGLDGQRAGPFDLGALGGLARSGRLTPDTLAWCTGMANWTRAADVPTLAGLFAGGPPPLPPQG